MIICPCGEAWKRPAISRPTSNAEVRSDEAPAAAAALAVEARVEIMKIQTTEIGKLAILEAPMGQLAS